MKQFLSILIFIAFVTCSQARSFVLRWNGGPNTTGSYFTIKEVDLVTGALTTIGNTTALSSVYDLDEIFYDAANNQIVGLYDSDLWKYNLTTNTDQVVDLGTDYYRDFIVAEKSYLLRWNGGVNASGSDFTLLEINLATAALTTLGNSTTLNSVYDVQDIYYDGANNQVVAMYNKIDLWKYNLANNMDQIVDLGSDEYRDMVLTDQKAYLLRWNGGVNASGSDFTVLQINLASGALTTIGNTTTLSSVYDMNDIYYDAVNNQIVGLYNRIDLWKYNLTNNTDQILDLGVYDYRCISVSGSVVTSFSNPTLLKDAVRIFPNPVQDVLNIDLTTEAFELSDVEIYNSMGVLVYSASKQSDVQKISLPELASGYYQLKLSSNGKISTSAFVKN